jgi:hypothetical protein
MDPQIAVLLEIIDQAFDKKAWHGTTLRGSLRGVDLKQARWRPAPDRNSIHDLVQHTAYWKFLVRRLISGAAKTEKFPRSPANWPKRNAAVSAAQWTQDIALLEGEHAKFRAAVAALAPKLLKKKSPRGTWTWRELIHGVAAHDLYHAGQIQLLKRLYGRGK